MTIRRLAAGLPLWAALAFALAPCAFADIPPIEPPGMTAEPPAPPPAPPPATAQPDKAPPAPAPQVDGPDEAQRAKVKQIVDELREEAAKIRGLAWKHDVPADLLTRAQLKVKLEEMIKEDFKPDDYARDVKILRRMGLLTPDEDPLEISKRFLEKGIAGFYNPKTKRLYLIDGLSGDGQRPTILHELIHALEDQYIDLEKTQKAVEEDSDRIFAVKCAIEGSAETARALYEKDHPAVAILSRKEQAAGQNMKDLQETLRTTPAFLVLPTLMHYQTGPALVQRYVGKDYKAGIDRLYANDYPMSQEACLHPRKFVTEHRDLPRKLTWSDGVATALGSGWKGLKATGVGELDFALWMDRWLGGSDGRLNTAAMAAGRFWSQEAGLAAEGWDGMMLQILERDGKPTALSAASAWDSPEDAGQAARAIIACLQKQHGDAWKFVRAHIGTSGMDGIDFTSPFGAGRVAQRDDRVYVLDGVPEGRLEAVWAALEATKIERDPKDTWSPATEADPLAGSTWQDKGIGWKAPEGFTAGPEGTPGTFVKGGLKLKTSVIPAPLPMAVMGVVAAIKGKYPKSDFDPEKLQETIQQVNVSGKEGARIDFVDATDGGDVSHQLFIVPVGEKTTLVIHAEGAKADWTVSQRDLADALEAFLFKD